MIRRTSEQDVSELAWFKSSNGNEGDCVEVAAAPGVSMAALADRSAARRPPALPASAPCRL
ncbi:DUF397 domain-containing protein [Streptomyces sp. NPDC091387]|uniref:DUF397 domain-containing protein n=1 Tax=Streptomyces sp. NPDC091387 TaxID=3365998 RepID=UPI003811F77B